MFEEYGRNCNDEAVVKIVGKLASEFTELQSDLQKQIKVRNVIEEVLYNYTVTTKETSLVASDIEDKIKIYLDVKRLEGTANSTLKLYKRHLLKFASCLRKPISSVTTMDLRMFLALRCKNMKSSSSNNQISTLKSFFGWLNDEEYIPRNPTKKLKATKKPKRVRHALTEEEVELLRQACKTDREKALIEFLVSSGCRLSEVININIEDIDWHEMNLFVIGKGDKQRKVYFSVKAKILLQKYLESRKGESNALFTSIKYPFSRLHGRAIEKMLKKISERTNLGKSVFPHLLRHCFATHNINSGMPLPVLQELMGHSSCATTQIYAQLSQENIEHEYKKIY